MRFNLEVKGQQALERRLRRIADQQVKFALAGAATSAAFEARQTLVEDWNRSLNVKRRGYIRKVLRVRKADKRQSPVTAILHDRTASPILRLQIRGGTDRARGGGLLRVPLPPALTGTGRVKAAARDPRRLVRIKNVEYLVTGRGKRKKLVPAFALLPSVRNRSRLSLRRTVRKAQRAFRRAFPIRLRKALATARIP